MRTTDESGVPESGDWSAQPAQDCREGGRVRLGARGVRMAARSRPGLQPSAIERIINHALSHRMVAPRGGGPCRCRPAASPMAPAHPSPLARSRNRPAPPAATGWTRGHSTSSNGSRAGLVLNSLPSGLGSCQFAVVSQC